jgi:CHAT domain-containing protein/tetratricopeptide (TPR) repeat protein
LDVLTGLGDVSCILSRYETAIEYYRTAVRLNSRVSDQRAMIDLHNRLAATYLEMAKVKEALPLAKQAKELSEQIDYSKGVAEALDLLGVISSISGEVTRAQESIDQALAIAKRQNARPQIAKSLLNLGYLNGNLGNRALALDYYRLALAEGQSIDDRRIQALALTAMAGSYALEGDKQKALDLHNQALTLFRGMGNRSGEAIVLNGLGYLYDDLGNKRRALTLYTQAWQLFRAVDNASYAAITLGYIGRVHFALGNKREALNFYQQKLIISRSVQDHRMEAHTLRDLGNVFDSLARSDEALTFYQQALGLSREVMDRRGEALTLQSRGSLYEKMGATKPALADYQAGLKLLQAAMDRRGEISILYNIARLERDLGDLMAARHDIEGSLDLIENLRAKVTSPGQRISFVDTVYQHYEFYLDVLMQLDRANPAAGYATLALEVNEHARARTLLENLNASRIQIRQGVEPELLDQEELLQRQLNEKAERQMRLLSEKHSAEQADLMQKEVDLLASEFENVEARVRERSPRYADLTQPRQLLLPDIQRELGANDLVIVYSMATERSYAWVVTSASMKSFVLPGRAEIERAARAVYELLESNDLKPKESPAERKVRFALAVKNYPAAAAKLSSILLDPLRSLLARKRIVIVADGILQYIPFAALPDPGVGELNSTNRQPLVVNHEIIALPSVSTLAALRKQVRDRPPAQKGVAVVADPVFEADDPRVISARRDVNTANDSMRSPISSQRQQLLRAAEDLGGGDGPVRFQRLPFSLQEALAIFQVVPESDTKRALGFDANLKSVLNSELQQYRIVHFATHGLLNNSYPELSGIVLSLVDKDGRSQDGFLRLNEIYNLSLSADLVVLSACQTGLGKEARGEGLIGLTRGFMYAGAPRVVASLWRIDDRAASELMRCFYEAMFKEKLTPAAALRSAQIRMWQAGEWRFPHYWAAFVLQGEWN